ncbi:tyrosine-type recombinase/integrase [Halorutilales archaeon Cl-col2-1]
MTEVWLTESEIETLELQADKLRDRLIIQLGAYSGMRIGEVVSLQVSDLGQETVNGELRYFAKVEGKKTDQDAEGETEKKIREAWITRDTWKDLQTHINQENLNGDDYVMNSRYGDGLHKDSARKIVKRIAEKAYNQTDKEKFLNVSSHDLRRFFAHYLAEEQGINIRVVMDLGGWEDLQTFVKHYLDKPSKRTKARELEAAGWR